MPNHDETTKRNALFAPLFSKNSSFLLPFFTLRVTLVTAKKQHRCWKARATRVREKFRFSSPLCFLALLYASQLRFFITLFCKPQTAKQSVWKIFCRFSAIFSLFGAISTHILIGAHRRCALLTSFLLSRRKPNQIY